mmetsp:Transcript_65239/g.141598  ORF Transcript_65239/g.141598 Transcript_65239/m.141598 type:complete len:244 (+) Transcript_65239:1178-1909(+)
MELTQFILLLSSKSSLVLNLLFKARNDITGPRTGPPWHPGKVMFLSRGVGLVVKGFASNLGKMVLFVVVIFVLVAPGVPHGIFQNLAQRSFDATDNFRLEKGVGPNVLKLGCHRFDVCRRQEDLERLLSCGGLEGNLLSFDAEEKTGSIITRAGWSWSCSSSSILLFAFLLLCCINFCGACGSTATSPFAGESIHESSEFLSAMIAHEKSHDFDLHHLPIGTASRSAVATGNNHGASSSRSSS